MHGWSTAASEPADAQALRPANPPVRVPQPAAFRGGEGWDQHRSSSPGGGTNGFAAHLALTLCAGCSAPVPKGANFCTRCGRQSGGEEAPAPQTPPEVRRAALRRRAHLVDAAAASCRVAQQLLDELQTSTNSLASSLKEAQLAIPGPPTVPSITVEYARAESQRESLTQGMTNRNSNGQGSKRSTGGMTQTNSGGMTQTNSKGGRKRSSLFYCTTWLSAPKKSEEDDLPTDCELSDTEAEVAEIEIREKHFRENQRRASVTAKRVSLIMDPFSALDLPPHFGQLTEAPPARTAPPTSAADLGTGHMVPATTSKDAMKAFHRSRTSMPTRVSLDMPSGPDVRRSLRLGRRTTDRTYSDIERSNSNASKKQASPRKTSVFHKRATRMNSMLNRNRATDVSDSTGIDGMPLEDFPSETEDESESESSEEDFVECKKKGRRGGVSTPGYGQYLLRLAVKTQKTIPKDDEIVDIITESLKDFAWIDSEDVDEEMLDKMAGVMEIEEFEDQSEIVTQGDYGRSGYIIVYGEADVYVNGDFKRTMPVGRFFGEFTMLFGMRRGATVKARGHVTLAKLKRDDFLELVQRRSMDARRVKEEYLRNLRMFDTLGPDEIAKVADAMESVYCPQGSQIITQNEYGDEMFLVLSGECQAECRFGTDVQKHRHYKAGDRFGEKAFIEKARRAATVTAITDCKVLCLRRSAFRRMMGNLDDIQQEHYMHDPRKTIADFYRGGNQKGPRGVSGEVDMNCEGATKWFAVYRPTSRDAIAKMLSGTAVGKGLNVKGKSSKKNHLSGFVPFLQISEDRHKPDIEDSPPDSRVTIYYQTDEARRMAQRVFNKLLLPDSGLELAEPRTSENVDTYTTVFGLTIHEKILRHVYIMEPPLAHTVGWETGRPSVPAFMNMNMHAVREQTLPKVVLYQFDSENALNPHGLLIAYAETFVKPVVSDFDTFTIGSKGFNYATLAPDQQKLAMQALKHTENILEKKKSSWSEAFIEIYESTPHDSKPVMPKYGFGDATSIELIESVITSCVESGAVRHGAECFNFSFPQELDDEFLIISEDFDDKPWRSTDKPGLCKFLLEKANEGFSFPLNPVWPVRDEGWYEIYEALRDNPDNSGPFQAWYPPQSGIAKRIEELHRRFPRGFIPCEVMKAKSSANKENELCGMERADFEHQKMSRNWKRLRAAASIMGKLGGKLKTPTSYGGAQPTFGHVLAAK